MTDGWSNIEISSEDPEIKIINDLETKIGKQPDNVKKVRNLITRFEVCHFKYQDHLIKNKASIQQLEPVVDNDKIGSSHIRHGENAWKTDKTGRSFVGQQYIWALKAWLNKDRLSEFPKEYKIEDGMQIHQWLGKMDPVKIRMVQLLLARLTYDWKAFEEFKDTDGFEALEFQVIRMDTCHYAFPYCLDKVIMAIGQLQPYRDKEFEGCGTFTYEIKEHLDKEFTIINDALKTLFINGLPSGKELIKAWLWACLAKTIQAAIRLSKPLSIDY